MNKSKYWAMMLLLLQIEWTFLPEMVMAQGAERTKTPTRAPRPKWTAKEIELFFEDAREHLRGPKPGPESPDVPGRDLSQSSSAHSSLATQAWSQWIDGDTLETEIKRIALNMRSPLRTATVFNQGGFRQCRRDFTILAVLFAVIEQFDQEVRWKGDAAAMRDASSRCGKQCQSANAESFQAAKQGHATLLKWIQGNRVPSRGAAEKLRTQAQVADRAVLMQWMQWSLKESISRHLGNKKVFLRHVAPLEHQAKLMGMLSVWIQQADYEFWEDSTYQQHALQLGQAAAKLSQASKQGNYQNARLSAGQLRNSCSQCHEDFRG